MQSFIIIDLYLRFGGNLPNKGYFSLRLSLNFENSEINYAQG